MQLGWKGLAGMIAEFLLIACAQAAPAASEEPAAPTEARLRERQAEVRGAYLEFESLLARLADLLGPNDPDRAALLVKAFSKSKRDLVGLKLQKLLDKLDAGRLDEAIPDQEAVLADMNALLELLLTEDHERKLRDERERLDQRLQETRELAEKQKALRAQTERNASPSAEGAERLAESQEALAQEAKELAERIRSEGEKNERSPAEDWKDGRRASPDEGKPPAPGEPNPSDEEGAQRAGEAPSETGASSESQPPGPAPPSAQRVASARRAMQRAKERLRRLEQKEASREQDEAIRELEKSIEELEQTLRQLREEERLELLANLESRLRKILEMQQSIHEETLRADQTPPEERSRADEQRILQLSRRESAVAEELGQVVAILVEDGTAVAFPETAAQLQRDARTCADRLARFETGKLVQTIQADVIATLREMIDSLQREMEHAKKKQKPSEPGRPNRSALVEKIAELKMIRSLQARVNERTEQIEGMIQEARSVDPAVDDAIRELADRQARIYQITRDVAEGKNE